MKKFIALLIAVVMVFCLVACAQTPKEPSTPDAPANDALTLENIKIGFVHVSDPSDMGYTYNHDLGTQKMIADLGLREDQIVNKYNIPEGSECETALRELVEAGCNIIFATSFGFEDYVINVATDYPNIEFCHATGYQAALCGLPNVHNYFVSAFEARYLAGIAAGLKTQTNKLGYVAAMELAEVVSGYTAFYLGAKSVNPDVTMDVMYTNDWNNPTVESQVAQALIDGGCDVLGQHCDSTAPATTAAANNVWQCGYNSDMIPAAPNASLVSSRADWSIYLEYAVNCMIKGEKISTDWCQGLSEKAVYLSPLNEDIIADGTKEAIDAATADILSGKCHVFDGPLTGTAITEGADDLNIPEGEYYHESETASAPSFAYIIPGINIIRG